MTEWEHGLSNVDKENERGICAVCGPVRLKRRSKGRFSCYEKFRQEKKAEDRRRFEKSSR